MRQRFRSGGLASWSVRRPIAVVMLALTVVVLGLFSLDRLAIDLLPHIIYPEVRVRILDPGVPSRIMEDQITRQLEEQLAITEEAIAIANDSRFGLVSYGWTENMNVALKLQESIRAGTVWINTPLLRDLRAPFGGFKDSGIGRDGPRQCAEFYTEEKAAIFARGKAPIRRLGSA